jgi:hypothetical protein
VPTKEKKFMITRKITILQVIPERQIITMPRTKILVMKMTILHLTAMRKAPPAVPMVEEEVVDFLVPLQLLLLQQMINNHQ